MATKYKYDKDTDYAALMERAAQRGDNAAAAIYEQQRNAKIRGEGMTDVTQSNDYAQYLPLEDVPDYDDTHRRQAESLLTERDTTGQRARIDQMLDALLGEEFDYDPASDKLYAAYRQQYERQADLASANALGAAAALTGGRASTAAVAAAQQAGGYYRAMLAGKLPELAQLAYERYNGERKTRLSAIDAMLDAADSRDGVTKAQIAALLDMDDADYDRADSKLQQQAKDAADRKAAADKKAKEEKAAQEAADKAARSEARRQITLILRNGGTVTTAPTETTPGVRTFTCTVCGDIREETIPATGAHDYQFTKTVAPTCTDGGYDLYTCSGCGATERRNLTDAAGHKWDGGTVTTAPTETTPGVRTFTCTVCGQTRTEAIPATGASTCTGGPSCPSYGLHDVAGPGYWAHEGIDYCVRNRLMSGVGAGTFSPDTACTRAQIVKILYNRSGNQTDYSYYYLPFTDVAPGAWYYNAVAWAYYNDVTSGTSATMFTPNAAITRQQLVTFLYRYTVKYAPEFTGNAAPISAFPDAGSVANWAYAAMSWAVGNGLIQGNAHDNGLDYLDPNGSATRAQTATIIMRYCQLIGA